MNKDTFCAAPWFIVRNDNNNTFRPCCVNTYKPEYKSSDISIEEWRNIPYMVNLRKELAGGKPKSCQRCWDDEDAGVYSQRQFNNGMILRNDADEGWVKMYFKHHNHDYKTHLTVAADIKTGNICNLECAMCHPWDSSKIMSTWEKNPSKFTNSDPKYYAEIRATYKDDSANGYLDELFKQPLKFLKILGGEPLLDKNINNKLQSLPLKQKNQLTLFFITNGTIDLEDHANTLQDFKDVHYAVSIDAFGKINNYIRKHGNWMEIYNNMIKLMKSGLATHSLAVTCQALNIFELENVYKIAGYHNWNVELLSVQDPDYLSLNAVPPNTLAKARELITVPEVLNLFDNAVFDPVLYEKFLRFKEQF